MNKSIMMGRLVKDPDIRYSETNNGELAIANFRLAVDRKYVREGDPTADFFRCTAFGRKAEFVANYLYQGIKVVVEGRMQNDNYTNRDGDKVYGVCLLVEDVDFAESKKAAEDRMEGEEQERGNRSSSRNAERGSANRSDRAASSGRTKASENGRKPESSRRSEREEDYEDDRERDSGRRSSGRNAGNSTGSRNTSSRSSNSSGSSRRTSSRSRDIDEEYMSMDAADEELDFD